MFWLEWILAQSTRGHALYTLKTSTGRSVDCPVGQYILLGTQQDLVSTTLWIAKSEIKENDEKLLLELDLVSTTLWIEKSEIKENYEKLVLEFLARSQLLPFSITAQAFCSLSLWLFDWVKP